MNFEPKPCRVSRAQNWRSALSTAHLNLNLGFLFPFGEGKRECVSGDQHYGRGLMKELRFPP